MDDLLARDTTLRPVPLVPEIALHTADDVISLWEHTGTTDPPFWAFPWAGGQALARHVLDHPATTAGRRVLDLACGSGLVAIAAARTGAHVTANDVDPLATTATTRNAAANAVDLTVLTGDLLDTDPDTDVVLAGDVFYDRDMAARVLPFLLRAHTRGATVLVGDPQRAHLPRDRFTEVAVFQVPVSRDLEGRDVRTTTVWRPR
ncbi:50S ribosomal protein L11 methyltransferase [Saccharothrix coeruleofusca]|uniref:50S ribosomal protein L11 methyltransferase n=1 Tax=Saccharothrix coeruleofusca TaxID=33919 RepID=A0A918ANI4_9PSEU|nr:50S ribosomal protein L11 methyltransferase [Saccharothrix coeruleofusca]